MAVSQPRRSRSQPCKIDDLRQIVVSNLFSQLNNLTYVTLDPVYSSICGYTEDDLDAVFAPELAGLRELFHTHPAVPADPTRKVGSGTAPPPSDAPAVSSVFFGSSPAGGDTYERGETIDASRSPVSERARSSAADPSRPGVCRR